MSYLTRIFIATLVLVGAVAATILLSWNFWVSSRSIDAQNNVVSSLYMLEKMSSSSIDMVRQLQVLELEQQLVELCAAEQAGRDAPVNFHFYMAEVIAKDSVLTDLIPVSLWELHEEILSKYPELNQSD